jgi:general secretion pathway protein F
MPVFAWRALSAAGRAHAGTIDADTSRAAWQALRARGVYPTDVREATGRSGWRPPGAGERALVLRQLATLVRAGVPLAEALADTQAGAGHPTLAAALGVARTRLAAGEPLATALAASPRAFPPCADLVRAGEASGALPAVLLRLADHAERSAALRARVRAALVYPAVMTAATAVIVGFLMAWVVPEVSRLFADSGRPLPLATRLLLLLAHLVRATWWIALPIGMALAAALLRFARTPAGRARLDALAIGLPVAGPLVRTAAVARFARALATLVGGGVRLEDALAIAGAATANVHLARAVARAREAVREGAALAAALAGTGELPATLVRLVAAGERSGALAETLGHAADASEVQVERAVTGLVALVEPALVLVMGGVVLGLVVAVLLPLVDLSTLVR